MSAAGGGEKDDIARQQGVIRKAVPFNQGIAVSLELLCNGFSGIPILDQVHLPACGRFALRQD